MNFKYFLAFSGNSSWEGFQQLTVQLVPDSDWDLLESVQDVQLGDVQRRVAVDGVGVLQHNQIQPTTSSLSPGGDTDFEPDGLQSLTFSVQLFGWERTLTDTCGVGLHDTVDVSDGSWRHTQTGDNTTNTGVGRGNVWIGTKVDIQHQGVGTFDKDLLLVGDGLVDESDRVNDVRLQCFSVLFQSLQFTFKVVFKVTVSLQSGLDQSSQVDTLRVDQTGRQHVEIVLDVVDDDGMTSIVTTGTTTTNIDIFTENIN
ncbi:hypothetical protein WICPIJ_003940 [Wickerhamomyces pijperi]|uniref:Uncharacterized protein n=1 Tax=Wickerhamomyces pijperi TaxID=599730 RepID=A0A9P8Q6K5_WICPI|nr:hypothetical protein WICPIJ_003940 [Wickerhamomyces pijperi]